MATLGDNRETALLAAFIRLTDTLVADFDLLHRLTTDCVALFPADAAGLLIWQFVIERGGLTRTRSSASA